LGRNILTVRGTNRQIALACILVADRIRDDRMDSCTVSCANRSNQHGCLCHIAYLVSAIGFILHVRWHPITRDANFQSSAILQCSSFEVVAQVLCHVEFALQRAVCIGSTIKIIYTNSSILALMRTSFDEDYIRSDIPTCRRRFTTTIAWQDVTRRHVLSHSATILCQKAHSSKQGTGVAEVYAY
jgi:hypothetical protein